MKRIVLQFCSSSDVAIIERDHYVRKMTPAGRTEGSKDVGAVRGHHGQQIHYLIWYPTESGWEKIGAISGGSAVYATGVRDAFFRLTKSNREAVINGIIDNTLFRLNYHQEKNLASKIVSLWRRRVVVDWEKMYGVLPYGFETFVEYANLNDGTGRQRAGSLYLADNWTLVGETSGNTKNHVGKGLTGGLHGNPFNREAVSKKLVFCKWIMPFTEPQPCEYRSSWRSQTPEEKALAKHRSQIRKQLVEESRLAAQAEGIVLA
jgi:hypothetical protein